MDRKQACIIIDLRTGEHVVNIPGIVAVLSAAGWKTQVSLKEYGGETIQLAKKAAKKQFDLVIGYGGDGTLNALLNGIAFANGKSTVADIPGGTFNVWAGAIGVPKDPIKAALALVNSQTHKLDLGHLEVTGLVPPDNSSVHSQPPATSKKAQKKALRSIKNRQYFLLNVGLGLDARLMDHISKPLKYRLGPLAFDVANVKDLPKQRPFPVEIQQFNADGQIETSWQGDVWQVYVSKIPLFGGSIQIEPDARADDGLLYLCLVTANGPVKTVEQILSILTQHKPDEKTTYYFKGTHFIVRAPASVDMHVDGSISKLRDLLQPSERPLLEQTSDLTQLLVDYRFDIQPEAVQIAVPRTYDGPLFTKSLPEEHAAAKKQAHPSEKEEPVVSQSVQDTPSGQTSQSTDQQQAQYKIAVIGTVLHQEKQPVFIVAGNFKQKNTEETQIVALRVTSQTLVLNKAGEHVPPATVLDLQEGQELLAEGNKTKRGVIHATCLRLAN